MNQRVLTPGLLLTILLLSLAIMMGGATFLPVAPAIKTGLALTTAPVALPAGVWNSVAGIAGTIALCGILFLINKRYSLLKTGQPLWFFMTLPILSTLLPASTSFNSSQVVMGVILIAVIALYESYKLRNATRNIFFAASCLSIVSFWQYGVIFFIPAIIASLFAVHVARFKEIIALLMGLAAPYWIVIGFGMVHNPDYYRDFAIPRLHPLPVEGLQTDIFPLAVTVGIMMLTALLLTLYNGIKLYAGNSRIRNFNNVINLLGLSAAIAMVVDTANYRAYCGVFAMWVAIQFGNLFTLWSLRYPKYLMWTILLLLTGASLSQILYLNT